MLGVGVSANLYGECGPLGRDWRCPSLRIGWASSSVALDCGQEAGLGTILCHLSQDSRGPESGRLEKV